MESQKGQNLQCDPRNSMFLNYLYDEPHLWEEKEEKFFTLFFMLLLAACNTSLFENRSHMNFLLAFAETMWKTEVPLAQAKWLKSQN